MATFATIGSIKRFCLSKVNWEQYVKCFEQCIAANQVANKWRVATFLTVIGAEAYSLLANLITPNKPKELTSSELVEAMCRQLKPKLLVIAERFQFHCRVQESVTKFMAELCQLANKCNFGTHLDEALRDRLVCGLHNVTTQKKLLAEEDLTLKKAYGP